MTDIHVNGFVDDHLDDMVVITGLPRSGTTILGKLVGSFDSVEYAFEPPMVTHLDANRRHGRMTDETVAELLRVYLYYDHFVEYLHGRRYNFREKDATAILGMKNVAEVFDAWSEVDDMQDAISRAPNHTFAFKFPGAYDAIGSLVEAGPDVRVVDIGRNLDRVVVSLLEKRWFYDENLGPDSTGLWPFIESDGDYVVPYLVDESDRERWQTMSPETRTVYVCNRFAEARLAFHDTYGDGESVHTLRYERLVEEPAALTDELCETLDLSRGTETGAIVDEIRPTTAGHDVEGVLDDCAEDVRERFEDLRVRFAR